MFEQAASLARAAAGLTDAVGSLLAGSLALAFLAVFLAVTGIAAATPLAVTHRRLGDVVKSHQASAPSALADPSNDEPRREAVFWPLVWALALPLGVGSMLWALGAAPSWAHAIYVLGLPALLGWMAPGRWRGWQRHRRRAALRFGFPDALDMMVVCVEAGLGLDAALSRVALEIAPVHPPVANELTRIGRELRAGRERGAVLRGFAQRSGLPEIASFATLVIQSEALGTGIARSLRVQAEDMRAARMLRAEERAHTLPVKLTAPLVICILPAMIAVVLLPGVIAILRDILPNLGR